MQKAEAQHMHTQSQSTVHQSKGVSLESPQSEQIAQLEAMIDSSPQVLAQRCMMDSIHNSPRMAAQRKTADAIYNSPYVTAQRRQLDGITGKTAQREEVEEPLQPKVAQREEAEEQMQPEQLNALAYAQGTDILVAPGQEQRQHLPHEAWHVVQQAQGRVQPTMQMREGVPVNDDQSLEREADVMEARALQVKSGTKSASAQLMRVQSAGPQQQRFQALQAKMKNPAQRRTLEQAGLHNGMAAVADQAMIGGDVGPTTGTAYTANLGVQANKAAALSAAGVSYAGFVGALPVSNLLSRTRITEALSATHGAITAYIAGLEGNAGTTEIDAETHIKQNILSPVMNPVFKTDVDNGELSAILAAMRNTITKNGANKFFANPKAAGPLTTYIREQINGTWRANANVPPVDPFLYRAQGTVGGVGFGVTYQHSPDWPGYVTHIQDDATVATMRLNGAIANPDTAGIPNQFGRKHHPTGGDNLAADLALDAGDSRVTNERRLDSMTKLAGEGARFLCVRNNLGAMADTSRFYVTGDNHDDPTKYVTLEDLWSSWATPMFNKANNIANATVRAAIVNGAEWTYGHQAGREAKVFDLQNDPPMGGADVDLT